MMIMKIYQIEWTTTLKQAECPFNNVLFFSGESFREVSTHQRLVLVPVLSLPSVTFTFRGI